MNVSRLSNQVEEKSLLEDSVLQDLFYAVRKLRVANAKELKYRVCHEKLVNGLIKCSPSEVRRQRDQIEEQLKLIQSDIKEIKELLTKLAL